MNQPRTAFTIGLVVVGLACAAGPPVEYRGTGKVEVVAAGRLAAPIGVPPPGSYYHGVYPGGASGEEDDITAADVDAYEQAAGRTVAWVYFSHNWFRSRRFPLETATWIRARGAAPFVRLMLRSSAEQGVAEPVYTLDAITSGAFDADLMAWGDAARDFGTPLIAEYGTEVNGRWFSWNGVWNGGESAGPAKFRAAYRRIVETIRGRGASNVSWAFHFNAEDNPGDSWNAFENYYPGDDVVDWVGVSVYGATTPLEDECPRFPLVMDRVVPRFAALAPAKPLMVLEFGVAMGNPLCEAPAWADEALGALLSDRWTSVRGFSWWNETWQNDDQRSHDTDMRVQTVPGLADVFRRRLLSGKLIDRPL